MSAAQRLNADSHAGKISHVALQQAMRERGDTWHSLVTERCPHLFADVAVFITPEQMRQMRDVIAAVERVVWGREWVVGGGKWKPPAAKGVFFGYDFHLNADGTHLIEINTNAGGGFLNAFLLDSQRDTEMPGKPVAVENTEQAFLNMFLNEWRLARGDAALKTIAIVDEQPQEQFLYPEFLLAQALFERAGIAVHIVAPSSLRASHDGLYVDSPGGTEKIDLVYNRLTDFSLQHHPALRQAYVLGQVVLTPHPHAYAQYADKHNLARLTNVQSLRLLGAGEADITTLQSGIPDTVVVQPDMDLALWSERKQWFFKPVSGYGGKGAYRGANVTRRVFGEIMQGGYVAQKFFAPGGRVVSVNGTETTEFKYDLRCYVYEGQIQLVAARLYRGQTTNFRTPGGGFALVRVVE